jgi:hypothetical protein
VTTKDRVGAGLAVVAAIIGLVLVFSYREASGGDDDDDGPAGPAAPPSISQVVPAPGLPGQVQQPAPGQVQQQPAQQPAQPDNDGDDDDN